MKDSKPGRKGTADAGTADVDMSDALLWSDCPEELYLQRMLKSAEASEYDGIKSRKEVSAEGSIVSNLMVEKKVSGKVRHWTDWAPIASSKATDDGNSRAATPVSAIQPVEINFDDEATSVATNVSCVPAMVHMENERAIEMDKAGMSTLSGDTGTQRVPKRIVDVGGAMTVDMEKTGISSLSGDTGIQRIEPAVDYTHLWIPVEDVTYARPVEIRAGKIHGAPSTPSTQHSPTFGRMDEQRKGCCGFLRRATEDRLFRRVVNIAVVLLVIFVALSAVAMIKSTVTNNTSADPGFNNEKGPIYPSPITPPTPRETVPPGEAPNVGTTIPSTPTFPPATLSPPTEDPTATPSQADYTTTAPIEGDVGNDQLVPSSAPLGVPPSTRQPTPDFPDDPEAAAARNRIVAVVTEVAPDALETLGENSSPQFQALAWLVEDLQLRPLEDGKILQRWILAVFFFSMQGFLWIRSDGWLTPADECEWFTTTTDRLCNSNGVITRIDLRDNNLGGIIPTELALLSNSLDRVFLNSNERIGGTLPASLGRLTNLERLHLTVNQVRGSIPMEFGALTNLEHLALGRNDITGTLPSSLAALSQLRVLDLALNSLIGTIPKEYSGMTSLTRMSFTSNQLSGTVPTSISWLSRLAELKVRGNALTGSIPPAVCAISTLQVLEVSCDEVLCSCCNDCR
mmetsp:Transcript_66701/g.100532  ORF Transcript_66701/g.100532 Transcript_66701/m.100532 type:complete len:683 (+) Transcript_66701:148-2196(+)